MATTPSPYQIERAFTALAEARQRLLAIDPTLVDDQPTYVDNLDGLSPGDPFGAVDKLIEASLEAELLAEAVQKREVELAARRKRFLQHREWCRDTARDFLTSLGISKLQRPSYTASVGLNSGKAHVPEDPSKLPPELTRIIIEPDKAAISAELKAGREVPGCSLGNRSPTITIRTR
jgi:hypothetical protein